MGCLGGCLLFVDGIIAASFFALFMWLGMVTAAVVSGCILGFPLILWMIRKCIKRIKTETYKHKQEIRQQAERDRRNCECRFSNGITEDEFSTMAYRIAKRIRRLRISVKGPRIVGDVESQSGISTWSFEIDFNDYGQVTGAWWMLYKENFDSNIPTRFAELLQQEIENKLSKLTRDCV